MQFTRITSKYVYIDLSVLDATGNVVTPAGADVALLPVDTRPTAATAWVPTTVTSGTAKVLVAGPDGVGDVVAPAAGADLWVRVTDSPEVDAAFIERIVIF